MFYLGYKYGMNKVLSRFDSTNNILEDLADRLERIDEVEETKQSKKIHQMIDDIDKKSKQLEKDKKR